MDKQTLGILAVITLFALSTLVALIVNLIRHNRSKTEEKEQKTLDGATVYYIDNYRKRKRKKPTKKKTVEIPTDAKVLNLDEFRKLIDRE